MFQIGSSLREARERRGLSHADVERGTRIRPRFLRALEEEKFDVIPARAYTIGFLREYADFLGLDGQQFVDEFSSRFPPEEEQEPQVALQPIARPGFSPRLSRTGLLVAGSLLAVLGLVVWLVGLGGTPSKQAAHHHTGHKITSNVSPPPPPPPPPPKPTLARLTLDAATGPCWFDAHLGSQTGPTLRTGMLDTGQSVHFSGKRIWIRLGAPTALVATLDGKRVQLPQTNPVNVLVTPTGIRTTA